MYINDPERVLPTLEVSRSATPHAGCPHVSVIPLNDGETRTRQLHVFPAACEGGRRKEAGDEVAPKLWVCLLK